MDVPYLPLLPPRANCGMQSEKSDATLLSISLGTSIALRAGRNTARPSWGRPKIGCEPSCRLRVDDLKMSNLSPQ